MLTVGMDDYLDNGLEPTDWVGGRYWVLVFAQKIARRGGPRGVYQLYTSLARQSRSITGALHALQNVV